jgi:hypothetical protein
MTPQPSRRKVGEICAAHLAAGSCAGAWCLVLGAWCLVLGAWCLVLGASVLGAWWWQWGTHPLSLPHTQVVDSSDSDDEEEVEVSEVEEESSSKDELPAKAVKAVKAAKLVSTSRQSRGAKAAEAAKAEAEATKAAQAKAAMDVSKKRARSISPPPLSDLAPLFELPLATPPSMAAPGQQEQQVPSSKFRGVFKALEEAEAAEGQSAGEMRSLVCCQCFQILKMLWCAARALF